MSVNSFIVRLIATRLLRGATWAGDQVLNSPVEPIDEVMNLAGENPRPVIGVFVSENSSDPDGRDVGTRKNRIELGIFIYLPPRIMPLGNDTLVIDAAGAAMALDMVTRQIMNVLRASGSPWRDLWEKFVIRFVEHDAKPVLIELQDKVRIAAAEIRLVCETLGEPPVGQVLSGPWLAFDALLRSSGEEDDQVADLLKGVIEFRTDTANWQKARALMAWSESAARASGIASQDATQLGDPTLVVMVDQSGVNTVVP